MVKKTEDFGNFVSSILQNSMLTGIPQIASAGNCPKRIIRTLVFFMCMAGFIYQSLSFMRMYWEYEVIMDVRVENPSFNTRPSLTICSKMGFKPKQFCEDPESKVILDELGMACFNLPDDYTPEVACECNPRLCDFKGNVRNLTFLPSYFYFVTTERKRIKKYMLTPKEMIFSCLDIRMREGDDVYCPEDYTDVSCPFFEDQPEYCFTMSTSVGNPNKTIEKIFTESEIEVILYQNPDNYHPDRKNPLMAVSIHNPYTIMNPFSDGFTLESDYLYNFHLQKVVKKLLPAPYKTDCMDYRSMWYARGGRSPTNLRECILECQRNISMKERGCMLFEIYLPTDDKRCNYGEDNGDIYVKARECAAKNCRPACYEEYYTITVDSYNKDYINCRRREEDFSQYTRLLVKLNGMETTVYTYSPKFEDIETFSYVGGYVGMWLGISLVAVFDFVETVFAMLKYPLRRFRVLKERRRNFEQVRRFQRHL